MKRRQLPSASLTYISRVPQVWSTGATAILTPLARNSAWRASTLSTRRLATPPKAPSPENEVVAVEVLGGSGVGHVKERDGERQQSAPHGEGMRQILQRWRTREEAA